MHAYPSTAAREEAHPPRRGSGLAGLRFAGVVDAAHRRLLMAIREADQARALIATCKE
jgi:hypothetical protein